MAPMAANIQRKKRQSALVMDECLVGFIRRSVLRLSLSETEPILKAWGFLSESDLQTLTLRPPKENIAMEVVHLCEAKNTTMKDAAALDIVYYHANPNKKNWNVYQLSKPSDTENDLFNVSEFQHQFVKSIHAVSKNVTIDFKEYGDALWIRIAWGKHNTKPNQYNATFAVYYLQSPFVCIANLPKTCRPVLCQALVMASKYSQIQEMELKSRCLESLKDIIFRRVNQSSHLHHPRTQDRIPNPKIVDPRVTYENIREKEKMLHLAREAFGDGPLPKLEHASYKLETMFRDENVMGNLAPLNEPFRCVVTFSSPHLLESIRSMALSGIAEVPVSNLLTCIPQKARNVFRITDKKGAHPTNSQASNA
ncbi:centromere protein N [Rhinophrynus dorsalis]